MQDKYSRFRESRKYFRCPKCRNRLFLKDKSLVCDEKHCFDISKYGYVNLVMGGKQSKVYSKETFVNRQSILEKGYYEHILKGIFDTIEELNVETILDVGCGEGYYSRQIQERLKKTILAFDISKDSVQLAAQNDRENEILWFVGDLSKIPMRNKSVDCILDIYSPANYGQFRRILKEGGYLIKVIPGENHLKELRGVAQEELVNKEYSNDYIVSYFKENIDTISHKKYSRTVKIDHEDLEEFINMTPLFFNVDKDAIDWEKVNEITVEGEILVGKV